MLFNSLQYLFFFPIVVLIYFIIPNKIKYIWLLIVSYYFYMCWNAKYIVLILFSTIITYSCGILVEKVKGTVYETRKKQRMKKMIVAISLFLNFFLLFYFKYTNFALGTIQKVFRVIHIDISVPVLDIMLPVGISFFVFQAVGYTIDVYRDEIEAEKNFLRYALFVSFFPQLVAGPIERSKNLLHQLRKPTKFNVNRVESGLLTMAYGLFLKMVVADNISAVIDPLFLSPENYQGMELMTSTILFAFQVYCDFEGYTKLAIGSAEVLGYKLNNNFNTPYMAVSVKDFWKRWHISLTSWFRDYLYIPLGGSRKGKLRKQINTLIVFFCSGLWHGAAWHYVVWGVLNGLLSVLEDMFRPLWDKVKNVVNIKDSKIAYKFVCRLMTFAVIDTTWLFFRANSFKSGIGILLKIVKGFRLEWFLVGGYENMFASIQSLMIVVLSIMIVGMMDVLQYYGKNIKIVLFEQQMLFRWIFYWLILMLILYWGNYGTGYEQTQFIYFQF